MLWALLGCDPCAGWTEADVRDPDGLVDGATLAAMRATVSAFYRDSGATDACIDEVRVTDQAQAVLVGEGARPSITMSAAGTASDYWLRNGLCEVYDRARGTLGEDGISVCGLGPEHFAWADEVGDACGTTDLDPADAAVRAEVWVNAAFTPEHGALDLEVGDARTWPSLAIEGGTLTYTARAGELLAAQSWADADDERLVQLTLFDPWTGEVAAVVPLADTGTLYGGPDAVVQFAYDGGHTFTRVLPDGSADVVPVNGDIYVNAGAALGG